MIEIKDVSRRATDRQVSIQITVHDGQAHSIFRFQKFCMSSMEQQTMYEL